MKGKETAVNPPDHKLVVEGTRSFAERGVWLPPRSHCQRLAGLDPGAVHDHCQLLTALSSDAAWGGRALFNNNFSHLFLLVILPLPLCLSSG